MDALAALCRALDGGEKAAPVRSTPITLIARRNASLWSSLATEPSGVLLSSGAKAVAECLELRGASFFDELVEETSLLRTQVEEALAELVARGWAASDSFAGLRALLTPSAERKPFSGAVRRGRTAKLGMEDAGRWVLSRASAAAQSASDGTGTIEHVALILLRRYGGVFWRILEREAAWLPPWRELLRVYRRLESRGEIRGGRFVAGFTGEQFALPDAIGSLRKTRREPPSGVLVSVSGADPLNLVGILTPGAKLAALTGNRLLYKDGLPIASLASGEVQFLGEIEERDRWEARKALMRSSTAFQVTPTNTD